MERSTAIERIMFHVTKEAVITSAGLISREVYRQKDRNRNFYMLGSMGCALAFALGFAYIRPKVKVIVITGDGEAVMGAGTLFLAQKLNLKNIKHYILDNSCHESTGGQATCPIPFIPKCTKVIKISKSKEKPPRIPLRPEVIKRRFRYAFRNDNT